VPTEEEEEEQEEEEQEEEIVIEIYRSSQTQNSRM
jgi:hypothetical protein